MNEWITSMPFEKAISYLVFLGFLAFNAKEIQKMLKGGNGMWQQIEVLTAICLLFFIFYGIEIVFGHIEADHFVLSIFSSRGRWRTDHKRSKKHNDEQW